MRRVDGLGVEMDSSSLIAISIGCVFCVGGFITLIVVSAVVANRRERARQDALRQWAAQHGWQVAQRPTVDWGRRMPGRNPRGVTLALSGTTGGPTIAVFRRGAMSRFGRSLFGNRATAIHRLRAVQHRLSSGRRRREARAVSARTTPGHRAPRRTPTRLEPARQRAAGLAGRSHRRSEHSALSIPARGPWPQVH
jgi:hypothetical protein